MRFGEVAVADAEGAILAHSLRVTDGVLRKGLILDNNALSQLSNAGIDRVTVARLEETDLNENDAALRIAEALQSNGLNASGGSRGRANLRATADGLVLIDADTVHRINALDEAITVSTLEPFAAIKTSQVAATVKIITFGVPAETVEECVSIASSGNAPVSLASYEALKIGFVQTLLPGHKPSLVSKASQATNDRLLPLGLKIDVERKCSHSVPEIAEELKFLTESGMDIVLVLGASAIVDRRDVVPSAVVEAGGANEHLGLPVDPGNLMLFSKIGNTRILGIPGSARSSRLHGFDWVLRRLAAGITVTPDDLIRMGVGGMLKEMPGRPVSRELEEPLDLSDKETDGPIGALLLAAGQSRRMGRDNKMLVEIDDEPMVVHAARALLESRAEPVVVVLGHQPDAVKKALSGLDVQFVTNPDYENGLSTSLKAGLEAFPENTVGAVVALGDMPRVTVSDIDALIDAFDPDGGQSICVPTFDAKRGNPVLWARRYFADIAGISGDVGARHLIGENADQVFEISRDNPGILLDLDTPQAVEAHRNGD